MLQKTEGAGSLTAEGSRNRSGLRCEVTLNGAGWRGGADYLGFLTTSDRGPLADGGFVPSPL